MKSIGSFLLAFLILSFFLIGFSEGSWSPLLAFILSYACYKTVFCFSSSGTLYDPIDFIEDDINSHS